MNIEQFSEDLLKLCNKHGIALADCTVTAEDNRTDQYESIHLFRQPDTLKMLANLDNCIFNIEITGKTDKLTIGKEQ